MKTGILTRRFPFEKLLYDQATSMNEWRSLVEALDQLISDTSPLRWFVAGGFVAHQLGRTNLHGDVDIYVCYPKNNDGRDHSDLRGGWTLDQGYEDANNDEYFAVYNKENVVYQIILLFEGEVIPNVKDVAASRLNTYDFQVCQCALMSNGEYLVVDSCMPFYKPREGCVRKSKYQARLAAHDPKCKLFRCHHWQSVY